MRYDTDYMFWCVVDPRDQSVMGDILYQASLRDLGHQFKGGLTADEHPTLFTEKHEAEIEAFGRMVTLRASQAIAENLRDGTDRIEILDGDGIVLFESDIPGKK